MNEFGIKLIALCMPVLFIHTLAFASDIDAAFDLDEVISAPPVQIHRAPATHNHVAMDTADEYRLGAGDKIKIHVFKQPDMDIEVRLGASGNIRYPFLGKLHVTGMTLPSLEHRISSGLSQGYLINPQVRVSMEEFRPFYVNGEVKKPAAYPYQPGLTARKAISLAGGFTVDADKNKVFLIRNVDANDQELKIALYQRMQPGDILTVKKSFFFVNGEVTNPGKYPYQAGMTYRMALAMAGGLKEKSDQNKVYVVHDSHDRQTYHVDQIDAEIKSGDVITAKESFF